MPITTYAPLALILRTEDPDICEVLAQLPDRVIVKEVPQSVTAWSLWERRTQLQVGYSVLWFLGDTPLGPEWQVVNFYREGSATRINTVVSKELVLAYLYGCAARQDALSADVAPAPASPP
jgi:hypothetical protein